MLYNIFFKGLALLGFVKVSVTIVGHREAASECVYTTAQSLVSKHKNNNEAQQ